MEYKLSNELLTVTVEAKGGAMTHLLYGGTEYLWQGDPIYWGERAPHLFPVVGRLTGCRCTMEGETVTLDTHGFFRHRPMEPVETLPQRLTLTQSWDNETFTAYPRRWRVWLTYALEETTVTVTFRVDNLDEKRLYFYYGGHPGFRLPLEPGLTLEDYCVRFDRAAEVRQRPVTAAGFMTGEAIPWPLENGRLQLRRDLFRPDAVILEGTGDTATLEAVGGTRGVTVTYPQMPYLAIWQPAGTDAPFLCLEPWCALPDRQDQSTELSEKEGVTALDPGGVYENTWSITLR